MNTPQPTPKNDGICVTDNLLEWIMKDENLSPSTKEVVIEGIKQRQEYGIRKYNQTLMSNDGRDEVIDAKQEIGDLLQYSYKAIINNRLPELKNELYPYLQTLFKLLDDK